MRTLYVGIDNGVSGSIGFVAKGAEASFTPTPVAVVQDYTKRVKKISRLDWDVLQLMLCEEIARTSAQKVVVGIERPMINPTRFHASVSAARCLEATLITLKMVDIFYRRNLPIARSFLDSKEWQHPLLPRGTKGAADLKKASMEVGCRLYPELEAEIRKHKDADGLLIAHYLSTQGGAE